MTNFISDYLNKLRASDEKTKHKSAMTISIIASVVILSFLFLFFKDRLLNTGNSSQSVAQKEEVKIKDVSEENKIESPLTSFVNFFRETGSQFSGIKNSFVDVFSGSKNINPSENTQNNNSQNVVSTTSNIESIDTNIEN